MSAGPAPSHRPGTRALATDFNGAVRPFLGTALWALRTMCSYEDALASAIDVGGDTCTVPAVTGAQAGAVYGFEAIPSRWPGDWTGARRRGSCGYSPAVNLHISHI